MPRTQSTPRTSRAGPPQVERQAADARDGVARLVALAGVRLWRRRIAALSAHPDTGARAGRMLAQRHAAELALDRIARSEPRARPSQAEQRLASLAAALADIHRRLTAAGRRRFVARLRAALAGEETLVPLLHLARTVRLHEARGFAVAFPGFDEGAGFDLLISRNGAEAELVCDVMSAEEGHPLHRGDWLRLADRIDPDLQVWLAAHPGRYLLKLTLPEGLGGSAGLPELHRRILCMLAEEKRADQSASVVLRLDPLLLAAAQAPAGEGLMAGLRAQFGPEAHLAVTAANGGSVFVMAARAGRESDVAAAVLRRLASLPERFSGRRPGIIALFIDDTDRGEWKQFRDRLEIEVAARQFLNGPAGGGVVAVSAASRLELFGLAVPEAAPAGELRFRNPAHPEARSAALAPAISSLV